MIVVTLACGDLEDTKKTILFDYPQELVRAEGVLKAFKDRQTNAESYWIALDKACIVTEVISGHKRLGKHD